MDLEISRADINIFDGFTGEGYGKMNPDINRIIRDFASSEGILLDPVYSAKAFNGLNSLIRNKQLPYKNILFIHTGGTFGIFPFAKDLTSA